MKYIFFILSFIGPFAGFTQTLSKSDIRPEIGETYLRYKTDLPDSVKVGNPGTGQTWDLRNVSILPSSRTFFKVLDPSASPGDIQNASFVLMNWPESDTSNKNHTYYRDTVGGYYELGDFQQVSQTSYTNFDQTYRFPLKFGEPVTDDFCFDLSIFSSTYTYCGNARLVLDGTGTLLLKGMPPLQNIYRLRFESAMLKENLSDSSYNTIYFWYKPGVHHPIAHYSIYRELSGYTSKMGYIYNMSNIASVTDQTITSISVFPNPSGEQFYVSSDKEMMSLVMTDIAGNRVMHLDQINATEYLFQIDNLANGVYFLTVTSVDGVAVKRVLVER